MPNAVVRCPECGGPLPEGAESKVVECAFCKARVTPAKEPERVVVERVVVVVEKGTGETSLPCPRCATPLFLGNGTTVTIHGCGGCGGVWLDNDASQRVVQVFDREILGLASRAERVGNSVLSEEAAVTCPLCRATLARVIVRNVALDVCTSHGTWFDKNELRRVAEAYEALRSAPVRAPGYSYAAAAEEAMENQQLLGDLLGAFFKP